MNEQEIKEQYHAEPEEKQKKRKSDFWLKVISVAAAVLIWFWVMSFETQVTQRKFPSVLVHTDNYYDMNLKYGYTILNNTEMYIDVTLEGKYSDLNRIKDTDIYAYIDLNEVTHAGNVSLNIRINEMNNVEVVGQSQSRAILYFDEEIIRNLPVALKIEQMAKEEGIDIGTLSANLDYVAVSGPKGVLENLDHALVRLNLGTVERSLTVIESFVLIDKNGEEVKNKFIKTNESTITVDVPVTSTKEVFLKVNYKYGYFNEKNTSIIINPEKIKIKGSPDYIRSMDDYIIIGEINEKKYENDTTVMFVIPLREGVKNLSDITSAEVSIKFNDNIESKIINIATTQQNVRFNIIPPKDFEYHIKESKVQIKVLGNPSDLKNINSNAISATADFSTLTEKGMHTVNLDIVVLSDNNSVFCVGEYTVNVEIY